MKILVLSWRDSKHPFAGGAEQVMHEHMKGWVEKGHDVTLFTSHFKNGGRREILDGVKIIRRGFQYFGVHIAAYLWYLFGRHRGFDLVVDQFHGIPFFTPLYVWRVLKLAVIQEVAREVWLTNDLRPPFKWVVGWLGYLGEPIIFFFYTRIQFMTASDSTKQDLVKMGIKDKSIKLVPHGLLRSKMHSLPKKERRKTIIFLGALTHDKGIEDAIEAFGLLAKKGSFKFWVVGRSEPKYLASLKNRARELGLLRNLDFFGFVPQKKKFSLLAKAHLLINPSVREGWGLVNLEANSVGTPVVAYKSPGLVDSVKDGTSGILCKSNTPYSLAENIIRLLDSKKEYKRLQKGALLWSKNFTWETSRKLSLELIERIYDKKNS